MDLFIKIDYFFLDESSKFEKLKLIQKSKTSASFKNSHAKLFVSVKHDQLKKSDYSTNIDRFGNRVYLFKGRIFWNRRRTCIFHLSFLKYFFKVGKINC